MPASAIAWKGKTLRQITSSIQKNKVENDVYQPSNIFRALPLKIYRREIAMNISTNNGCASSRISSSIDELARPGGSMIATPNDDTDPYFDIDYRPAGPFTSP